MAVVEALMEEAEVVIVERGGTTLGSCGVDVAAEWILHLGLLKRGTPPVNYMVKWPMDATT